MFYLMRSGLFSSSDYSDKSATFFRRVSQLFFNEAKIKFKQLIKRPARVERERERNEIVEKRGGKKMRGRARDEGRSERADPW